MRYYFGGDRGRKGKVGREGEEERFKTSVSCTGLEWLRVPSLLCSSRAGGGGLRYQRG